MSWEYNTPSCICQRKQGMETCDYHRANPCKHLLRFISRKDALWMYHNIGVHDTHDLFWCRYASCRYFETRKRRVSPRTRRVSVRTKPLD